MLTDIKIRELLKLGNLPMKRREVPDGKVSGLYFVVQPSGAASWALRYRIGGVGTKFTIGPYPQVSLAAARRKGEEARGRIAAGKDPARENPPRARSHLGRDCAQATARRSSALRLAWSTAGRRPHCRATVLHNG